MPFLNTIPDPSQGLITCKKGMNNVDHPIKLGFNQCQSLKNLFPGSPLRQRAGIRDFFADDRAIGTDNEIAYYHTEYTPYSIGVTAPTGDEYVFVWTRINTKFYTELITIGQYYLEAINLTDGTREILYWIWRYTDTALTHFGFLKLHGMIYCTHDGYSSSGTDNPIHAYDSGPVIIYWEDSAWHVRQMGIREIPIVTELYCLSDNPNYVIPRSVIGLRAVVFNSAIYLTGYAGKVYKSTTGINWQFVGTIPLNGRAFVVYKGYMWLVAYDELSSNSKVYRSTDGSTWENTATLTGFGTTYNIPAIVVFKNTLFVYENGQIRYTNDGITWASATSSVTVQYKCIVFNDQLWSIRGRKAMYSNDGVVWTEIVEDIFPNFNISYYGLITYKEKMYLIGGRVSDDDDNVYYNSYVYESEDGETWTQTHQAITDPYIRSAHKWQCEALIQYTGSIYAIARYNTFVSSVEDGQYEYAEKWRMATGRVLAGGVVSTACTFVRRTDPAAKLNYANEYLYETWERANGNIVVGVDEKLMDGTVQASGTNVTGTGTSFTQLTAGVDRIRINGALESRIVTTITDDTHIVLDSAFEETEVETNHVYNWSLIPEVGDPVTTTVYEPGDLESSESIEHRHIVELNTSTEYSRIFYGMPNADIIANAVQQGATHLRAFRTVRSSDAETAKGLTHGWVADIAITGTSFSIEKIYRDSTTDTDILANIALNKVLVMTNSDRSYSPPPNGRYIAWCASRVWIAGEEGALYCSEVAGGDGAHQTENELKYASEFCLSQYKISSNPDSGYKRTGLLEFFGDVIEFFENRIFVISSGDRLNEPVCISHAFGCPFPETIVKANHPALGLCVFFVSERGPAVLLSGNTVQLIDDFKIQALTPQNDIVAVNTIHRWKGVLPDWDSRNRVTAHYSDDTYWVHFGESDQTKVAYDEFKCYGYYISSDKETQGAFEVTFPSTIEPQAWVATALGVMMLSQVARIVDEEETAVYRATLFSDISSPEDRIIHTVAGQTPYSPQNSLSSYYTAEIISGAIPISLFDRLNEVFAIALQLTVDDNSDRPLQVKLSTDLGRLYCEGNYTQSRQSGVSGLTTSHTYKLKAMIVPNAGLLGSHIVFELRRQISSTSKLSFFGASVQVISRNLPCEFKSGLGALQSTTGALTFVEAADQTPETDIYAGA